MTYEEAITELKAEIELYDNEIVRLDAFKDTPDRRLIDALEMAIEALGKQMLNNADGCIGCAFESYEEWEMPCRKCKRNCKDYWRAKTR